MSDNFISIKDLMVAGKITYTIDADKTIIEAYDELTEQPIDFMVGKVLTTTFGMKFPKRFTVWVT